MKTLFRNSLKIGPLLLLLLIGGVVAAMVAVGALISQASFELEVTTGALHYGTYLVATILLRLIMGMGPRWLDR